MEGETQASSAEVEVQLPTKLEVEVEGDENLVNGKSHLSTKGGSKEDMEEEVTSDDFIKIEKESIDVKEVLHSVTPVAKVDEIPSATSSDSSNLATNADLQEVDEKIKALEQQLAIVARQLEDSESEKLRFKSEIGLAQEKLEKMEKHCEQLESDRVSLKDEVLEAELKYNKQLESLQEALGALEVKQKELVDVKEALSGLSAELENSKNVMEEFESKLVISAAEARKFEDISNEKSSHAEVQAKKALEFENMLEAAKLGAKDMEDQIGNLQEELKGLYDKITENQKVSEMQTACMRSAFDPIFLYVLAPDLPKGALVEVKPVLHIPKNSEESVETNLQQAHDKKPHDRVLEYVRWHGSCCQKYIVSKNVCCVSFCYKRCSCRHLQRKPSECSRL